MEFSRQEYWTGSLFLSPGALTDRGIEPRSPSLQVDSLPSEPPGKTMEVVKVKVVQSCLTLCDPMDYTVYGILQARILEWVAFPFFRGSAQPVIEPRSPALQADSLPAEPQEIFQIKCSTYQILKL